ncbi:MAG: tail fiber protein [Pseudomonadota bacterium]
MTRLSALLAAAALATALAPLPARAQQSPMMGQVILFAGNFCPRNYMPAQGQILPIAQWDALFSILGTVYGGDGRTTFGLPDLRGRLAKGVGQGPGLSAATLGEKRGQESVTLTESTLPSHTHAAKTTVIAGSVPTSAVSPSGALLGVNVANSAYVTTPASTVEMAADMADTTVAATGGSTSIATTDPSLVMTYCIAVTGLYPTRN